MFFTRTIRGWWGTDVSWAAVFQSIDAFTPLVHAIARRHGLPVSKVTNLTPGSNAVFRMGNQVYKIFAPEESGTSTLSDYACELAGMAHGEAAGVIMPKVLAQGCIQDKYAFRYIVMDFIDAPEAGRALPLCGRDEKTQAVRRLKKDMAKMNVPYRGSVPLPGICDTDADRWDIFPASLMAYWRAVRHPAPEDCVFVHGDLTGDNVLLLDGRFVLLDFADCHVAPPQYEWSPLLLGLLGGEPDLLDIIIGDWRCNAFIDKLADAYLMHDFGAVSLEEVCGDVGIPCGEVTDKQQVKMVLRRRLGLAG